MQEEDSITPAFKTLSIIYYALGAGMLFSLVVFYILVSQGGNPGNGDLVLILSIVVPVMGIIGFGGGRYLAASFAQKSRFTTNVAQKFTYYRTACLISWAMLEAPALLSGVAYFLTGDSLFSAFFAMIFLVFLFNRPSITKFQQDF